MTTTETRPAGPAPVPPPPATRRGFGDLVRNLVRNNLRQYGMIVALGLIVVLFQIWTGGILLKPLNATNIIQQNSYILILAIGMVIVIITGHIDLSVGSIAAFSGATAAVMMVKQHVPWPVALVACLVIGAAIGAWQGYWIAYVGIPSFIVTLAGMLLFRGATQYLLSGQSIAPFPTGFQKISNGFLPEIGYHTLYHYPTLILGAVVIVAALAQEVRDRRRQASYGFDTTPMGLFVAKCVGIAAFITAMTLLLASYKGIPVVAIILIALFIAYAFVMRTTVVGRHSYAVGGNSPAARLSGVKNQRVVFAVFVNMGVLAALAGLVFAARLNAGTPNAGVGFELEAIAAAFIGGASASGGVGTVLGAIVGGLVLGVLNNGMSLLGIGTDIQQMIKGLVLLAAVGFDIYNKKKVGS
jgi:putative multiple sugar transport system permease protein